ncbi:reductase [Amycolatopsis albispora]|uniref:reductase n=1 Tax=Amycolatopsis albispora TaxID=1804986 RepID=UPI001F1AC451|nr:reductase [Amycolatopsis albispora]
MRRALILGGTGCLGRAVARRLVADGWRVDVTGRDPGRMPPGLAAAGVRFHQAGRGDPLGTGVDLLVDCTCFTAAHAEALLPLARHATSTVMISSKAVYRDDEGRHANSAEAPRFAGPVTERQPTLPPGTMPYDSAEGYGPNKVAAERTLLDSGLPVTVLRPSKVHGEGASPPREWYFVKRALDRRPAVLLARRGRGADQPSAAVNLAALVAVVADQPGARVLNAADPDAPDGLAIARIVAAEAGHRWREVLLDDNAPPNSAAIRGIACRRSCST